MSLAGLKAISHPGFGHEVARRGSIGLKLLTKLANENAEIFDLFRALSAPDGSQQSAVIDHFARAPRHIDEKIKLLRS